MSSVHSTPNFNLSQFDVSESFTHTDYNNDMLKIDNALKNKVDVAKLVRLYNGIDSNIKVPSVPDGESGLYCMNFINVNTAGVSDDELTKIVSSDKTSIIVPDGVKMAVISGVISFPYLKDHSGGIRLAEILLNTTTGTEVTSEGLAVSSTQAHSVYNTRVCVSTCTPVKCGDKISLLGLQNSGVELSVGWEVTLSALLI